MICNVVRRRAEREENEVRQTDQEYYSLVAQDIHHTYWKSYVLARTFRDLWPRVML